MSCGILGCEGTDRHCAIKSSDIVVVSGLLDSQDAQHACYNRVDLKTNHLYMSEVAHNEKKNLHARLVKNISICASFFVWSKMTKRSRDC